LRRTDRHSDCAKFNYTPPQEVVSVTVTLTAAVQQSLQAGSLVVTLRPLQGGKPAFHNKAQAVDAAATLANNTAQQGWQIASPNCYNNGTTKVETSQAAAAGMHVNAGSLQESSQPSAQCHHHMMPELPPAHERSQANHELSRASAVTCTATE
jgi:hypothetical protein